MRATSPRARMPLSVIEQPVGGHARQQVERGLERDSKVRRLRLLMPMSGVFERERALELGAVVHLDQHRHAERARRRLELAHLRVVEAGGDQQDAVGAERARLERPGTRR